MATQFEISYYNSFILRKTINTQNSPANAVWPGVSWRGYNSVDRPTGYESGYPPYPGQCKTILPEINNWVVEEARIRGGFNNTWVENGVKAHIIDTEDQGELLGSGLIYSGIYNSRTGVNELNVFSTADDITKSLDPSNGSIQKLHAEDTNLVTFQEDKINKVLIDKDAIYSAEGGGTVTSTNLVLGQVTPYVGKFGISKNPESFAFYGNRKYCADKNRGTMLRLSQDGITPIGDQGMRDYFRDQFSMYNAEWQNEGIIAIYDDTAARHPATYTVAGIPPSASFSAYTSSDPFYITLTQWPGDLGIIKGSEIHLNGSKMDDIFVVGWNQNITDFKLYTNLPLPILSGGGNLNLTFVSQVKDRILGSFDIHNQVYSASLQMQANKYNAVAGLWDLPWTSITYDEQVKGWTSFLSYDPSFALSLDNNYYSFNKGILYNHYTTGNRNVFYNYDYTPSFVEFVFNPNPNVSKNFKTVNYEGSNGWQVDTFSSDIEGPMKIPTNYGWNNFSDTTALIPSYNEGLYINSGSSLEGAQPLHSGFNRKDNRYVANLINNSGPRPEEIIWGDQMTGIKGYTTTVKLSTDNTTNTTGVKDLFVVGTEFVLSSK